TYMHILAIETSCDETSAAVIEKRGAVARIRSNIVASQVQLHVKTGGVVPEVAAREHVKPIIPIIHRALQAAGTELRHLDAIAVTYGPGLHTALSVGVETAKALSYTLSLPLIPVNHLHGHLASTWNGRAPKLPALCLVVSGGHTELVLIDKRRHIKLLGATRDDAAGEAFDKVAQLLRLGYPGGPAISKLAKHGDPRVFDLPRPMLDHKNLDFSFAGLKTAVRTMVDRQPSIFKSRRRIADLCASFQAAVVDVLVAKTIRAAQAHKPKEVLLAGGVAANSELRRRLAGEVKKLSWKPSYRQPPLELCTDNAGMIGLAAAYFPQTLKQPAWKTADIQPTLSI
ncbi:MAG: tRNA (adenosine(37)-N6)-threonylcarbamoyltransferase complex transferase subunit TsaD, partial [Candidatus Kerfeldbacteria bacterium]|nr:tRNA (adenosine(37)-N6)-threonylcarbamoyltransferase complex transferase subunit TsaD [Candidatus Kerfeldbacteria bacterium]